MSKTLSTILTIFKVAKIVAKVIFILCIVGAAGCLLALVALPIIGINLPSFLPIEEDLNLPAAYLTCIAGLITCVGEAILTFLAERYFGKVLTAGTPFTLDGAKESFRLGVAAAIIAVATATALGMTLAVCQLISSDVTELDVDTSVSLSTGLFFMFLSLIFKHGAEIQASAIPQESTSESETL